jgi:F-type H+-transporting ATPase subunit delta
MSAAAPDVAGTVFDEETSHVAKVYAEALLGAAAKTGEVEAVVTELEEIDADVLRPYPRFALIFASPSVSPEEKARIGTDVFEGRALPTVVRFLKILNNHGRLAMIAPIAKEARAIWDHSQNRRPVTIKSAVTLDDGQKLSIKDQVAKMIGATPLQNFEVDPSLIGGLVIQDGDNLYDGSLKTKLSRLRRVLIEGKSRDVASNALLVE